MSKKQLRIAMYITVLVLGAAAAVAGGVQLGSNPGGAQFLLAAGLATVATGVYAWIRGLGPLPMPTPSGPPGPVPPGFYITLIDGVVIIAFFAAAMILAAVL